MNHKPNLLLNRPLKGLLPKKIILLRRHKQQNPPNLLLQRDLLQALQAVLPPVHLQVLRPVLHPVHHQAPQAAPLQAPPPALLQPLLLHLKLNP